MATKSIDKNKLKLPAKKEIVKPLATAVQAEIAVEKIHATPAPASNGASEQKKLVRYSFDIPYQMHRDFKVKCFNTGIDMKAYVISLLQKDLYPDSV